MKYIIKFIMILIIAIIAVILKNEIFINAQYEIGVLAGGLNCLVLFWEDIFFKDKE